MDQDRGKRMARRLGVSREDVIAAAVTVSDRDGIDDLTVAAVAGEVGCRPPSVYHHVDGLGGLLREVSLISARDLRSRLAGAAESAEGLDAVSSIVAAAREWAIERPARFDALRREPADDDDELIAARRGVLAPLYAAITGLGVAEPAVPTLVAAIEAALRGCIASERDSTSHGDESLDDARRAGHELLMGLVLGHVAAAADSAAASTEARVAPEDVAVSTAEDSTGATP